MGGNGANSFSSNSSLVNTVARATGLTNAQVMTRARNAVTLGLAPNMRRALQMVQLQNTQAQSATNRNRDWANMSLAEEAQLRRQMGQTGDEAGRVAVMPWAKDYVATSKSYNINAYLNSGQKSFYVGWKDQNGKFISNWHQNGLKENNPSDPHMGVKQIINKMDNGMSPLPRPINVTRLESSAQTLDSFNVKGYSMQQLKNMDASQLTRALYGQTRAMKGYMSTTTNESGNRNTTFKGRDVIVEYTVSKGVHGIMTNNTAEREFIVGRGYDQKITAARWEKVGGEDKLVLSVRIVPNARSEWFNLR